MQPVIKTSCENCALAIFFKQEQLGCALNRIEKFKNNATKVETVEKNNKTFYVIKDRFCNAYITSPVGKMVHSNLRRQEITTNIELVITCTKDTTLEEIITTYNSELQQTLPSKRISIGVDFSLSTDVVEFFRNQDVRQWRVETVTDDNYNYDRYLYLLVKKVNQPNFVTFKAGTVIPPNFNSNIDNLINDDLRQVSMIEPQDGNGMFASTSLYLGMGGDYEMSFIDKVKGLAEEHHHEYMILQPEEIWTSELV